MSEPSCRLCAPKARALARTQFYGWFCNQPWAFANYTIDSALWRARQTQMTYRSFYNPEFENIALTIRRQ
jgi:hypothetical protein